ncbi:hypothetical protein BDK51DRAFT_52125 [Blyttiomyces helicus]|uniref:Chitin-binding type-4 domain-containing protein n=1 Tax=Blyttiomyces helicus TaxID=388810 RepID=A0A4P9VXQ3_9FUNG|nr:hypothetical protein BDK51DRAFT_52125 [Blyttiomyces helicus]|eukprot:RKO84531.1 hypothetical protein BDK51DRAFT_52125 [Blyttiomyces helicus]
MLPVAAFLAASLLARSVDAHGFVYGFDASAPGVTRNIEALDTDIDSLRNPEPKDGPICRGAARSGTETPLSLKSGEPVTIILALSVGAQHVGPCQVDILDADDLSAPAIPLTSIDGPNGCARPPIAQFDTDKSPASGQCPKAIPQNLVTDDMCLHPWTFTPSFDASQLPASPVLRWKWQATHISVTDPELYESCIDVSIGGDATGTPAKLSPRPRKSVTAEPTATTAAPDAESTTTDAEHTTAAVEPSSTADDLEPTPTPEASFSSSSSCTSGQFRCTTDGGFQECVFGAWDAAMPCAAGTKCQQTGTSIACGWP